MKCPKCKKEINGKAVFCGYCGTMVRESTEQREEKSSCKAEGGEAGPFRYAYLGSSSFCKRGSSEGSFLRCVHNSAAYSCDALFYPRGDPKEPAEASGDIDDTCKPEKLFSVSVYDKFLWMD